MRSMRSQFLIHAHDTKNAFRVVNTTWQIHANRTKTKTLEHESFKHFFHPSQREKYEKKSEKNNKTLVLCFALLYVFSIHRSSSLCIRFNLLLLLIFYFSSHLPFDIAEKAHTEQSVQHFEHTAEKTYDDNNILGTVFDWIGVLQTFFRRVFFCSVSEFFRKTKEKYRENSERNGKKTPKQLNNQIGKIRLINSI